MHFAFHPNRDSGSVRSHRNPDTKRRHGCSNIPKLKVHNGRARWKNFLRAAQAELSTGLFDVSFARVVNGWDPGDPIGNGNPVLVLADPYEEEEPYEDIPEWVWDELYAASMGVEWHEGA